MSVSSLASLESHEMSTAIFYYVAARAQAHRTTVSNQGNEGAVAQSLQPRKARGADSRRHRLPYVFDMETGDPDDVLTLLFIAAHPDIELKAVTIVPGSAEQVALVRWLLQRLGLEHIRLGAQEWPTNQDKRINLNTLFYSNFGRAHAGLPVCEQAHDVLRECCDQDTTLVTGAALHNVGKALEVGGFSVGRWVAQGGFAGEGVVPPEKQMEKFKGMKTCSTFNFGGNIPAAEAALKSGCIGRRICVSKNVCHSVTYTPAFHDAVGHAAADALRSGPASSRAVALKMVHDSMGEYLEKKGEKKLHDPLALAEAIDESVCGLVEVSLYCEKGKWGSRLCPGSGTWISMDYNNQKFQNALLGQ